ncbi:arfGAP with SH3 domain, ANK repeat and PH domain-containing protein-like isoform X2 [Panonychus citri]|uniref:arfGAP with SH3 domain, ANK repeat and PH domain-containing protein-like isoform X2 n=1 Tax=Panonychus citri TaxID=50023 RepID=UPI0023071291|nr:arfGAP with SH3 domain, ANK repeat and PH domain-containing protein-like isoform X2 [Panonychus citri]XP_053203752.1 arfGAP with SH3 domain, ANK repeat and PH domain-containing protein-like isoform X2 [Panonychus citri]XP_053210720.1 arfGAP with SH3 domain, ANK repeat and PH domain-containing protein-like isoform X2 [Panonychus citri]
MSEQQMQKDLTQIFNSSEMVVIKFVEKYMDIIQNENMLDSDREGLMKMKKALKAIHNSGNSHCDNEVYLSKVLDKLGENAEFKDNEFEIGAAFKKFAIVTKELSNLLGTLMQSMKNIVMFPLENILKGDLKGAKGDLKKPFDKAYRDYESKLAKIEKEKKSQAKESGHFKSDSSHVDEECDKERKLLQLTLCEYLIKVNEIKTKTSVELLSHLIDYYHAQTSYFQDGLKTIEHFNYYIAELSSNLQTIKQRRDEERKSLIELRTLLRSTSPSIDGQQSKDLNNITFNQLSHSGTSTVDRRESRGGYTLHQIQGNKNYGVYKLGYLLKKSEGKMKVKVWFKRRCEVKDGYLYVHHSDESKAPTKVNLLTCQVKPVPDEKKFFDLVSCDRTYRFQAEDENECEAWISVLLNSKENALKKEFDSAPVSLDSSSLMGGSYRSGNHASQSLIELRQSVINQVLKLPGNEKCVDCASTKDPTWLSTNFGVVLCIECSGIHRDLGVHISRVQSLTLDNIGTSQLLLARVMSNAGFNDIMEAILDPTRKLQPTSSMDERFDFIRTKYVDKKFALRSCSGDVNDLKNDLEQAILSRNIYQVLQVFVEGGNLNWTLPSFTGNSEASLHIAISREDGTSLHIIDFLAQNNADLNIKNRQGNTPLHYCVLHNQSECMKILLRCGANPSIKNNEGKTPLQLAKEKELSNLIELLEHANANKKNLFENVNTDWGLPSVPMEDILTDFSDEDIIDEKPTSHQPQFQLPSSFINRSRPSSAAGSESPLTSTLTSTTTNQDLKHTPGKGKIISLFGNSGSIKKKAPKAPKVTTTTSSITTPTTSLVSTRQGQYSVEEKPNESHSTSTAITTANQNESPSSVASSKSPSSSDGKMSISRAGRLYLHSRATSDTSALMQKVTQWKDISAELAVTFKNDPSSETKAPSSLKPSPINVPSPLSTSQALNRSTTIGPPSIRSPHHGYLYGSSGNLRDLESKLSVKTGTTPIQTSKQSNRRLSNGQSIEKLTSISPPSIQPTVTTIDSELVARSLPVPPPRKQRTDIATGRIRRCQALYDCEAERDDELTFKEGEIILILSEKTDDDDWMEGVVEGDPDRKGVFPTSFVQLLSN